MSAPRLNHVAMSMDPKVLDAYLGAPTEATA